MALTKNNVLLITPAYVKKYSVVGQNIEDKFIVNNIIWAEDTHLLTVLGEKFYEEIKNDVFLKKTTGTTISDVNVDLIDNYIQPMLLHYTIYEMILDLTMKITNKGVKQQNSVNSDNIDLETLALVRDSHRNKGEQYAERLINRLISKYDDYPNYYNSCIDGESLTVHPDNDTLYFNGVFLKDTRKDYYDRGFGCGYWN